MLNENALNAFLALAKTGSFQDAARMIGVSNASLTRYILQAETETGLKLFNRSRNNSKLTREGQEYLGVAQDLKSDLERYLRRVAGLGDTNGGVLRIGCGPLTTRTLILPALTKVREEMPDQRFEVLVSAYARPLDLLQNDQLDIFVGDLTYTPEADDVEILVMERRPVAFMAHPAHEIHGRGPQSLNDLFEFPFASPHLHKHWKATLTKALGGDAGAAKKVAALPQIESDDYAFLTALLDWPDFIVGGMREAFTEMLASKTVKEVDVATPPFWNICASRKPNDGSAALNLFWSKLAGFDATNQ
ncbi:LysR family transcriptional regulator [Pelagimonas varians]|uniref:HTH-type transcriptional regulator CynR n=1 Tax=Pelagimonas varians TaxID=696760 RepID=A0A238L5U4_9RHOB|nr:LysR family transcriptional regulator [Pelagimonas varians]PYG25551.1 DNA-binding transcriptional LysR family regulator [Pelagimonas varians]SMX50210.1 HTH-type transcriptional regulator CynR [Pelagimonas varians]